MPDRVGQQIGTYRLVKLLGKGGFAEVYLGQHVLLASKQAAIKLLHLIDVDVKKFQEEAETTEKLVHPHIVRLLDFAIEEGTPFLVLDYAPGGSLRSRHPRGSIVPLDIVTGYLKEIALAVQYAHDLHILHRDIKPDNVLIGRQGELLISDFGIAVLTQTGRTSLSGAYNRAGTPYYMAPETYQGKPVYASDQYALAVVVYEWLCGSVPFSQGDFIQLGYQHAYNPVPPLREKNPAIAPVVETVVLKALAKEPKDRFGSVQLFVQAFEQACIQVRQAQEERLRQAEEQERARQAEAERLRQEEVARKQVEEWYQAEEERTRQEREERARQTKEKWEKEREERARQAEAERRRQAEKEEPRTSVPPSGVSSSQGTGASSHPPGNQQFYAGMTSQSTMTATHVPKRPITFKIPLIGMGRAPLSTVIVLSLFAILALFMVGGLSSPVWLPIIANSYYTNGTLVLNDPLRDNSQGNGWFEGSLPATIGSGTCAFSGGVYHVTNPAAQLAAGCTSNKDFSNFAFEVQMIILKGDSGGIQIRTDRQTDTGYEVLINPNGQFSVSRVDQNNQHVLVDWQSNVAINQDLGKTNLIAAVANGSTITFYVNHEQVASVTDSTYSHGLLALVANSYGTGGQLTEVAFSNAKVWTY